MEWDPVAQDLRNEHVGSEVKLDNDYSMPSPAAHEPSVIRDCLVALAETSNSDRRDLPVGADGQVWTYFGSIRELLDATASTGRDVRSLMSASFAADIDLLIDLAGEVIGNRTSYKSGFTKTSEELTSRRQHLKEQFASPVAAVGGAGGVGERIAGLTGVQPGSDIEPYLGLCLALREFSLHDDWKLAELLADAAVDGCLAY